jgi:hypothetical protein
MPNTMCGQRQWLSWANGDIAARCTEMLNIMKLADATRKAGALYTARMDNAPE